VRFTQLLGIPLARHYHEYVVVVRSYTGAEVFVRDGTTQLASSGGPGLAVLPRSGAVSYQGKSWLVFSFEPRPPTRVYMLIPLDYEAERIARRIRSPSASTVLASDRGSPARAHSASNESTAVALGDRRTEVGGEDASRE
jgi:hypothetical protein